MSTVKSKKLQVGTDATSSNNFTIYQPATPDGTLRIGVGNADSPTEVGRFTSSGIDITGNVKADNPFFYATMSSAQTGFNATSLGDVVVLYNNAITNIGNHYNTSTGKFTCPVDGIYMFWGSCYSSTTSSFTQNWAVINGARAVSSDCMHSASNFSVGHYIFKLSAGDTVGFHTYSGSATNVTFDTLVAHTYFRGCLLYEI